MALFSLSLEERWKGCLGQRGREGSQREVGHVSPHSCSEEPFLCLSLYLYFGLSCKVFLGDDFPEWKRAGVGTWWAGLVALAFGRCG